MALKRTGRSALFRQGARRNSRWLAACAVAALPLALVQRTEADSTFFNFSTVVIAPGQSFALDLGVTTTHPWSGFSVYFNAPAANLFNVTAQTPSPSDTFFASGDSNVAGSTPWSVPAAGNSADFGYTGIVNNNSGNYDIETLTFASLPGVQNNTSYTLVTTVGVAGSETYQLVGNTVNEFPLGSASFAVSTLPLAATISDNVQLDTLSGGAVTITASGLLQVGYGASTGQFTGGSVINGGNLVFDRADAAAQAAAISGSGTVTQMGVGATTLTMAAAYTGPTLLSAGTLVFAGGVSHSVGSISGTGTLHVDAGATLTSDGVNLLNGTWIINGNQILRSSSGGGAYAMFAGGSASTLLSGTSIASNLTFGAGAHLDLRNNALIVETTPGTKAAMLAQIAGDVGSGAITSSTAAANPAYSLEVVDNAALGATHFGGLTVDANSIIVTQALLGDANLDGVVNPSDLLIWANNFNNTGVYAVTGGDFNLDGVVNPTDLLIWANNFNNSIAGNGVPSIAGGGDLVIGSGGGTVATPEPASLALLGLGAIGMLLRKRRKGMAGESSPA